MNQLAHISWIKTCIELNITTGNHNLVVGIVLYAVNDYGATIRTVMNSSFNIEVLEDELELSHILRELANFVSKRIIAASICRYYSLSTTSIPS